MTENFENKISRLELTNFTCFSEVSFEFSSGINVFIGENGTGKTHILKSMFSLLKKHYESDIWYAEENEDEKVKLQKVILSASIERNFKEIFKCYESTKTLIRQGANKFQISAFFNDKKVGYFHNVISDSSEKLGLNENSNPFISRNMLYLPPNEMISWSKGFINLYQNKEVGFEKIYYDLALALDGPLLRNGAKEEAEKLLSEIKTALDIDVEKKDGQYLIKYKNNAAINAAMNATGINKLAQIIYLIMNGSLTKDSILFWNEPEANLNPKYISLVAKFLQTLSKAGVQIFVATHDYLLIHQLSLAAEYREQTDAPAMRFFSLQKDENGTIVESGDTLVEINNNAILDEYAAFYDLESSLFAKSRK